LIHLSNGLLGFSSLLDPSQAFQNVSLCGLALDILPPFVQETLLFPFRHAAPLLNVLRGIGDFIFMGGNLTIYALYPAF